MQSRVLTPAMWRSFPLILTYRSGTSLVSLALAVYTGGEHSYLDMKKKLPNKTFTFCWQFDLSKREDTAKQ